MLYKVNNYDDAIRIEEFARNNNINLIELDEENYLTSCPNCGDDEFLHDGECGHCGWHK